MTLNGREIVLGVGGGISAYKSAELIRRLQDIGLSITVVPTAASLNFVGKATWEALSGREVISDLWERVQDVPHISLAKKSDAIVVAPATADFLARVANGVADDLLTNLIVASNAPKIFVPAMHPEMWLNSATQENVSKLRSRGILVIEPDEGRMTGEDVGVGRYPEVGRLVSEVSKFLELNSDFSNRKILVTAGGTRENIDPVRFIGNRSSGKQGLAIAEAARNRGAKVTLIGANISLPIPQGINYIPVQTTSDLSDALDREFPTCDALFMAAAVADAKPIASSDTKIKKADLNSISLEKNADLLATISKTKKAGQIVVGFSAETGDIDQQEASRKLEAKGLDVIYTNDVSGGAIFGSENTSGWILSTGGLKTEVLEIKKETLANQLLDIVKTKLG